MIRHTALRASAAISLLAALVFSGAVIATATPAIADVNLNIGVNIGGVNFGYGYFHNSLNRYGSWIHHPRWGDVWRPPHARRFRPYYDGYWQYSDYGLLWMSNEPWGDIIYHYGRLVWDPHYGWLWIPGYVWSPAWVIWRTGDGYFGWMPMPPDYGDYDDGPYFGGRYSWNDYYGYRNWYGLNDDAFFGLWVFVDNDHFYRHDYRKYAVDHSHIRSIIGQTNDATHYAVENDRIVNRSIPIDQLERVTRQKIQPAPARQILKSKVPIAPISSGRGLARQEGSGRPGHNLHDREFRPMIGPERKEKASTNNMGLGGRGEGPANPSGKESERIGRRTSNGPVAMPSPPSQPNAGEDRTRDGKNSGEAVMQPAPQPEAHPASNGGTYNNMRRRTPSVEETVQPSPQWSASKPAAANGERMRGQQRNGNAAGQSQGANAAGAGGQQGAAVGRGKENKQQTKPAVSNSDQQKQKKHDDNDANGPSQ